MKDIVQKTGSVNSQESMAKFVFDLAKDCSENKDHWVNGDLESFLYSLSAWIEDMDGYYQNTGQPYDEYNVSWKNFADMLAASTIYE